MDKYIPIITVSGYEVNQYFLTNKSYPLRANCTFTKNHNEEDFWWALPINIYTKHHALTLSEAEHAITWWTTKALNKERVMPTSIEIKKVD